VASESSFYRVLHAHQQVQRRGRARPPQEARPVPRRRADGPNQLWSWDITYLPTSVRGVWIPLPGGRRLEPQDRRLGRPRARGCPAGR
jgi:hypothetical protein